MQLSSQVFWQKAGTIVNVQSRWVIIQVLIWMKLLQTMEYHTNDTGQWTKASNVFGTWITQMSFTYGKISRY